VPRRRDVAQKSHRSGHALTTLGEAVLDPWRPIIDQEAREDAFPFEVREARRECPRRDRL
jgi:hypothetical protein